MPAKVALLSVVCACRMGFEPVREIGDDTPDDANGQLPVFDDTAPANCPASYRSVGVPGSKYRGVDTSATWSDAQAACVADGQHLLVIDDMTERSVVSAILPTRDLWLGVTDRIALGTWRTVTGDFATYLPWDAEEPDVDALQRCVEAEFPLYAFIDQDCTAGRRFICECDGRVADSTSY